MGFLAALVAFCATPAGQATVVAIPGLVEKIVADAVKSGKITAKDVGDYLSTQEAFDTLVPPRKA
jgi:hypothetical protein